jgi:hypothetical protein
MLSFDDQRWMKLEGGYRTPFDPRPWLELYESGKNVFLEPARQWRIVSFATAQLAPNFC